MNRLFKLAATLALLCFSPSIDTQQFIVELADVQSAKSLSAIVQDPSGSPIPKALVQEFSSAWDTVLRASSTDAHGRFLLSPVQGRRIYFLQISAPGFNSLRVRIQVYRMRRATLKLTLELSI
jgi:hypothetical protein